MRPIHSRAASAGATAAAMMCLSGSALSSPLLWSWSIAEFQPDIPNGGRANSIAIDPTNDANQWVASQSGGVFHSTDGGKNWLHVDAISDYMMGEIVYLPSDPSVMLATADNWFRTGGEHSGIWRSIDGGQTWMHVPNPPTPAGFAGRFSASDIAVGPDSGTVYVATSFGLDISTDKGQTWTLVYPTNGLTTYPGISSVIALPMGVVLASGYYPTVMRSTDGGATWTQAGAGPVSVDPYYEHAFGGSPIDPQTVYYVDRDTHLFFSENAGQSWTRISSTPASVPTCGGLGFIRLAADISSGSSPMRRLRLYFSNHCWVYELVAPEIGQSGHFDYSGSWAALDLDHGDTRDLAFTHGTIATPLLLATDGGLHGTTDGGATWRFTGGGSHGYNALQVTEARAQTVDSLPRQDLYFATQDNSVWASGDNGVSWTQAPASEGYFLDRQYEVQREADSLLTFLDCCNNRSTSALLGAANVWPDAPGHHMSPSVVSRNFVLQNVDGTGGIPAGLAVTHDQGATWTAYASFPDHHADIARVATLPRSAPIVARPPETVFYEAILAGFNPIQQQNVTSLIQVHQPWRGAPTVGYPTMHGFGGGIGVRPATVGWYEVFAVDPLNGHHLIAPEMATGKVMQSFDDANNWTEIPNLWPEVSNSDEFRGFTDEWPFVQAVSFYAKDSQLVALGTFDTGVFISTDGGATWGHVRGSEKATFISSLEWLSPNDLLVSTYGRGLWRIHGAVVEFPKTPALCVIVNCLIRYLNLGDPPPPESFDESIFVLDGTVTGMQMEDGRVTQVHVSVGGVAVASEAAKAIPTAQRATVQGLESLPGSPEASAKHMKLVGLGLDADRHLRAVIYAPSTVTASGQRADGVLAQHIPTGGAVAMSRRSPTANKPVLTVGDGTGTVQRLTRSQSMPLSLSRSPVSGPVEVLIDGQVVQRLHSRPGQTLRTSVPVPEPFGSHVVMLREAHTQRIVGGLRFLVRPVDNYELEKPTR